MANVFDLRPERFDIIVPAGDSFSLKVTITDPAIIDGIEDPANWSAQVRSSLSSVDDPPPDAVFTITAHASGVFLTLTPEDTRGLWDLRPLATSTSTGNEFDPSNPFDASLGDSYFGSWDAEVRSNDQTVVWSPMAGGITITPDITREVIP